MSLLTLEQIKKQLNIPLDDDTDDDELLQFGDSVTAVVERYVGAVSATAHTESFDGGVSQVTLSHAPVLSITSVTESGTLLSASDYTLRPESGVLTRTSGFSEFPFYLGARNVTVAYVAGTQAVAPNVLQAALIIVQHLWETQRPAAAGPFSQATDDFDPRYAYSIPRRALELLGEPVSGIG